MNRIDRLSGILVMLQSSIGVKPRQIMDRYEIGIRTVYRDIKALEESGIPIVGDSRLGYSLIEGYKLPPLMFTNQEAVSFVAAEKLIEKFTDINTRKNYKSGVEKIKAVMNIADKTLLNSIECQLGILEFEDKDKSDKNGYLQYLMNNIGLRSKLSLEYRAKSEYETTKRTIDPIGLFFSLTNWYLIAYCYKRNDYRTFKVDRIVALQNLHEPITKNHLSLTNFLDKLKEHKGMTEVRLTVSKKDYHKIDKQKYYQGLVSETENEHGFDCVFMTFSLQTFARWIMSYIDLITIVFPDQLKFYISDIIKNRKL